MNYPNMNMLVKRIAERALGKRVTPHILRHSSATFYANKLKNPYKLCYRYGWVMASKEVNRYLDREGLLEEETPDAVKVDDIAKLAKQNQVLREELSMFKESNTELSLEMEKVKKQLTELYEGKNFMKLLMALAENRSKISRTIERMTGKKFDVVIPH